MFKKTLLWLLFKCMAGEEKATCVAGPCHNVWATRNQLVYNFTRPKLKQRSHCHFCHARPLGSSSVLIQVVYWWSFFFLFFFWGDGQRIYNKKYSRFDHYISTPFWSAFFLSHVILDMKQTLVILGKINVQLQWEKIFSFMGFFPWSTVYPTCPLTIAP